MNTEYNLDQFSHDNSNMMESGDFDLEKILAKEWKEEENPTVIKLTEEELTQI